MNVESELVFIVNAAERTRSLLRDYIAAERLHVVACGSAAEYLSHPRRALSTCVLVDVHLPDMCGFALQRQIAMAAVPVIFVAHEADMTSSVRALKAGAADFLATPVCPTELVAAVHAAIERGRQARNMRARVAEVRERWTKLTPREREVMTLIVSGLLNKQVAGQLGISSVTVQIHRGRTMQKMAAESFADLVRMAHTLGIPDDHKRPAAASPAQRSHPSPSSGIGRENDDERSLVEYRSEPLAVFSRDAMHPVSIPSRGSRALVASWPRRA